LYSKKNRRHELGQPTERIGESVVLSTFEQRICKGTARVKYESNREHGITDKKVGSQSNEFTDLEGFAAEFAFCKLFNIFPDFSMEARGTSSDTGDAILTCGLRVDIKATKYSTGRLLAAHWKGSNIDFYVLMVGEFPRYTYRGMMSREELHKPERLGDLGYGATYMARQHELGEHECSKCY